MIQGKFQIYKLQDNTLNLAEIFAEIHIVTALLE